MPNSGMSCFAVCSAFWRLHESSVIVPFLIHPSHQDLYFASGIPRVQAELVQLALNETWHQTSN
jgi:hypothetical protein